MAGLIRAYWDRRAARQAECRLALLVVDGALSAAMSCHGFDEDVSERLDRDEEE